MQGSLKYFYRVYDSLSLVHRENVVQREVEDEIVHMDIRIKVDTQTHFHVTPS